MTLAHSSLVGCWAETSEASMLGRCAVYKAFVVSAFSLGACAVLYLVSSSPG